VRATSSSTSSDNNDKVITQSRSGYKVFETCLRLREVEEVLEHVFVLEMELGLVDENNFAHFRSDKGGKDGGFSLDLCSGEEISWMMEVLWSGEGNWAVYGSRIGG